MKSVVMVNTGMEQILSIPDERAPTGGAPTIKVRFNVRLCVAGKVRSRLGSSPVKLVVITVPGPLQSITGN